MSARVRQSMAPSSQAPRRTAVVEKPEYEPPAFPLTVTQQQALQNLARSPALHKLKTHLKDTRNLLTANAGEVNDRVHDRNELFRRRKHRAEQRGDDAEHLGSAEKELEEFRMKAEAATKKMEESIRKMIDGDYSVQMIEDSLQSVSDKAITSSQARRPTQTSSTRRRVHRRGEEEDDSDEEMPDFDPTDPGGNNSTQDQAPFSLSRTFTERLEKERDKYQMHPLAVRYSENNDYIGFKRTVHDALHPDDEVALPHASTWFSDGAPPAAGVTAGANDGGSDDDIAISRATISTKCQLTLQEFRQPYSSKKCPHSYEKQEILNMIQNGPPGGLQCPIPGCDQVLKKSDVWTDPIVVRKIRRIQRAREAVDDDGASSSPRGTTRNRRAESVGSDSGEDIDEVERQTQMQTQPKQEPQFSRVVASQIVDLGGDSQNTEMNGDESE